MDGFGWIKFMTIISAFLNIALITHAEGRVIQSKTMMKGLEGSSMILPCPDYDGGSTSTLGWYTGQSLQDTGNLVNTHAIRRGTADEATTGNPMILSNGSLSLFNLTLMDERWYTCDFMTSNSIYLDIIVLPERSEISVGRGPIMEGVNQDLHRNVKRVKPDKNVTFVWYLNNVKLYGSTNSTNNADKTTEMTNTLTHTFNVSQQGQPIICSITFNRTFTLNTSHTLNIFVMPKEVTIMQPDVLVDDGTIQTVTCRVDRIKPHNATITWRFDNPPHKEDPGVTSITKRDDGTFTLINQVSHRFNTSDNGRRLRCTVQSGLEGIQPITTTATLTVFEPGNATSITTSGNPLRGGHFTMMCSLVGTNQSIPSTAEYSWSYNGTRLSKDTDNIHGTSSGFVNFTSLRDSDNGIYTCAIRTEKGWTMGAKNYSLTVWYAPMVVAQGPSLVREGTNVTLTCSADYYPRDIMTVNWRLDDVSVSWMSHINNMNYTLPRVGGTDSGTYTCQVCNAVGCGSSEPIALQVLCAPQWAGGPPYDASELGEAGKVLVCNVSANPAVRNYTWTYDNGGQLRSGVIAHDNTLRFDIVNSADYTNYTCSTYNVIDGTDHRASFVIELRKKGPPNTPTEFKVLTNVTSRSISLSWKPGSDGSYPPQRFLVQYQAANDSEKREMMVGVWEEGHVMGHTLYNLSTNTNYTIWLQAYNQRPPQRGNNASETLLLQTMTTGIPKLEVRHLEVEPSRITVFWTHSHSDTSQTTDNDHLCIQLHAEDEVVVSECKVAASENQYAFSGEFRQDRAYTAYVQLYEGDLSAPSLESNRTSSPTVAGLRSAEDSTYIWLVVGAVAAVIALVVLLVLAVAIKRKRASQAKKAIRGTSSVPLLILRSRDDNTTERQSRRSSIYQYIDPEDITTCDDDCRPPAPPPRPDDMAGETAEPNIYSYSTLPQIKPSAGNDNSDSSSSNPSKRNSQSEYLQPVKTKQNNRESGYMEPSSLKSRPIEERDSEYMQPVAIGSNPTYGINTVMPRANTGRFSDSSKASDSIQRGDRKSQDKDTNYRPTSAVF